MVFKKLYTRSLKKLQEAMVQAEEGKKYNTIITEIQSTMRTQHQKSTTQ